jgi:hypothetical protein
LILLLGESECNSESSLTVEGGGCGPAVCGGFRLASVLLEIDAFGGVVLVILDRFEGIVVVKFAGFKGVVLAKMAGLEGIWLAVIEVFKGVVMVKHRPVKMAGREGVRLVVIDELEEVVLVQMDGSEWVNVFKTDVFVCVLLGNIAGPRGVSLGELIDVFVEFNADLAPKLQREVAVSTDCRIRAIASFLDLSSHNLDVLQPVWFPGTLAGLDSEASSVIGGAFGLGGIFCCCSG